MATELAEQTTKPPARAVTPERFRKIMDDWAADGAIQAATTGEKGAGLLKDELRAHAAELAGPNPSPLETALANTAALCWFALRHAESDLSRSAGLTIRQAQWHDRRIDHCHRRYLATLKTLATVRKLGAPALQINLAHQQVNVAGSPS